MKKPSTDVRTPRSEEEKDFCCRDLPSKPLLGTGKILVTGASGYVGGRLVGELLARGYQVRVMVRGKPDLYKTRWPQTEVVVADVMKVDQLKGAFDGIDTAYYLIHSLDHRMKEFETMERTAASNFRVAAEEKQVKRIIYLGGLGKIGTSLSHHLGSRSDVAIELIMGEVPVTTLRAAVIVGSGSASYELIHHLVKRLPVMLMPGWAKTQCQPVAIRDVIKYLVGVLETPETAGKMFDIGGKDILSYGDMLKKFAEALDKKIIFIPSPVSSMNLYSFLASLVTPIPHALIKNLMASLNNEVVCQDDSIRRFIPFELTSYKEAVIRAMTQEERARAHVHRADEYPAAHP